MKTKTIEQTYRVLDEIEHVRKRTGMYAGSTSEQTSTEWIYNTESKKMEKRDITYIPALIKVISEILDNSIDEYKRAPGVLDTIKVDTYDDGSISISDNGRGIPVVIHPETNQYIAEMVFSNLRAGSNFNDEDDQALLGVNGLGSTLTSILSSSFNVESCDGTHLFKQEFWDGMRQRTEPRITKHTKNYTKITFKLDYEFFKITELSEDHKLKIIKRVVDAAANNLDVKFYINGERIVLKSFADYIAMYSDDYLVDQFTPDWKVGVSSSDGFDQVSFVNSIETYRGGAHVDYITNQLVSELREYFKKKHKVDVKPGDFKAHMCVYISCNVNRPKFSSQTKENMVSPPSDWKTSFKITHKFIKQIVKSPITQAVLDWIKAKEQASLLAQMRKLNKDSSKADPRKVEKFSDANEKKNRHLCELLIAEGDSAVNSVHSSSGKNPLIGSFALKGKPMNIMDADTQDILTNDEIKNILTITGLEFGKKVNSIQDLRFGKIIILADQDLDGLHITGLMINLFSRFWPELFELGVIHKLNTPLYIVTLPNKTELEFFDNDSYHEWAKQGKKHTFEYFKGLGTFETYQFKKIIDNRQNYLVQITKIDLLDEEKISLAFSKKMADDRKVWLSNASYFNNYE